jgi:HlyD family secretion protein
MATQRRSILVRAAVIVVVLGAGIVAGMAYLKQPKASPIEYKSAPITRGDVVQAVTANGSLTAVRSIEVGSQISGTISNIMVDFNSKVTAGQVIAQIDPATYERNLLQADAELANAKASLRLAQANFTRGRELFASKLIAQSDYDQTDASLAQADAMVKMREANVERARVDLSRTTITAPIDGMVISRKIEVGQTVAASLNSPTLFVLANDLARMRIEAAVSEADVGGVTEGQIVNFTVDAFPRRQFKGTVSQVRFAPTTNQNVVTYTTIVDVENADLKLRPGMTANASIVTAERKAVLRIPNAALRFRPPEGAVVRGDTNAPAAGGGTNAAPPVRLAASGPFAGLPEPPWTAEGRRPNPGEREQWLTTLKPDERDRAQKVMDEMRARMAQGGGGGGFGGGGGGGGFGGGGGGADRPRSSEPEGPRSQTVHLLANEKTATGGELVVLKATPVKLGISDGTATEVLEGLKEGDVVVSGTVTQVAAVAPAASPFGGSPFGGPPRGR